MQSLDITPCPCVNAEERIYRLRSRYPCEKILVAFDADQYAGMLYGPELVATPRITALDCLHEAPCLQEDASTDDAFRMMTEKALPALPVFSGRRFLGILSSRKQGGGGMKAAGKPCAKEAVAQETTPEKGLAVMASHLAHEVNNICACAGAGIDFLQSTWQKALPILDRYHKECGEFHLGGQPYQQTRELMRDATASLREAASRVREMIQRHRHYLCCGSEIEFRALSLRTVAERAWVLCRTRLSRYTSQLEFIPGTTDLIVRGDPVLLEQAIINLLLNAGQALARPDQSIRLEVFANEAEMTGGVRIRDEGTGIAAEVCAEPAPPAYAMHGWGLHYVRRVVDAHQGSFALSPCADGGTVAEVRLALKKRTS